MKKEQVSATHKILTVLGIVLCVILIPILIINCTLLIKSYTNTEEVPSIGGVFPMIVLSDSMYPEFAEGDLIICKNVQPEQVKIGDVISYFDPQSTGSAIVSHRVYEISRDENGIAFLTQGDFNSSADPEPIPAANLVGIYTGTRIPGAGNIAMFMQTTTGLIVCVVLPVLLLVGYDILRRKRYEKKHDQDKEALLAELEELRKLKSQSDGKES